MSASIGCAMCGVLDEDVAGPARLIPHVPHVPLAQAAAAVRSADTRVFQVRLCSTTLCS